VLRVLLPHASGGERPPGLPTGRDRGMPPAIAQGIGPLFEPHCSTDSYGFRPGRRARMARAERAEAHREGRRDGVDCDLKRCFDTVHPSLVMTRVAKRLRDRRVWRLRGRSLRAGGLLPAGRREPTSWGVPHGGPLSPLRAQVLLDELDKEVERRGLRLARDADDLLLVVRSQRAAKRVLPSLSRFSEGPLRRRVNPNKSQAARLSAGACLGCERRRGKRPWTKAAVQRFTARVRELTNRRNGRHMTARIAALKRYGSGWLNDVGHRQRYAEGGDSDQGRRRRVRRCSWKQWQRPRTRRRHLLALGIARAEGKRATRSRKGHWRRAGNRIGQRALHTPWLGQQGVPTMRQPGIDLPDGASAP
jgi:RNA-directed DNA polymerase